MRQLILACVMAAGAWPVVGWTVTEPVTVVEAGGPHVSHMASTWLSDGRPIEGVLLEHDQSGALRLQVHLSHGRLDGIEHRWYGNGQRESVRLYREGHKAGHHMGWWPDGSPRFESTYEDHAFEGESRSWHANGRIFEIRHYSHGHEEGMQQSWTAEGALFLNYQVRQGRRYGFVNARPCTPVSGGA